jgi:hypothetical protein
MTKVAYDYNKTTKITFYARQGHGCSDLLKTFDLRLLARHLVTR